MKIGVRLIVAVFLFYQCNGVGDSTSECGNIIKINELEKLKVKDTLSGFWANTDYDQEFEFDTLNGDFVILFFKNISDEKRYSILLNEEVKSKNLGNKVTSKGGDLIVSNEAKLISLYGIGPNKKNQLKDNILIVADNNKVVTEIYKNACEDDIIDILNKRKTSSSKNKTP